MNVLLLGSGGREHAIAWKLAQSPKLSQLYTLPGNPGTAQHGVNLVGDESDAAVVLQHAKAHAVDLVVIGPEAPLAAGVADVLREEGFLVFGPSQGGAQLEASKAFAKDFMRDFHIPTGRYEVFDDFETAQKALRELDYPFVIKVSGLAAGKGVFLPDDLESAEKILFEIIVEEQFGASGRQVVIEERLTGPEVSVLAFTDGERIAVMPPAQDHKRLLNDDKGPNTGGMGVFAPSPYASAGLMQEVMETILQPTLEGLRMRGIDYRGVLYAGLMLTPDGPKVLEYNCRFGDPETQVILPLMDSDLLEIFAGTAAGQLPETAWTVGGAACVVLASGGYPGAYEKGLLIEGISQVEDGIVFHAGTQDKAGQIVTGGGRVLGVTAVATGLKEAIQMAYQEVGKITFENMHYRTDIGASASAYASAGVDIEAGNRTTTLLKTVIDAKTPEVLSGVGAFGGLYDAGLLKEMVHPVLVSSTDGVGTKVMIAAEYGTVASVGEDIVNHCINDILVQGARPLYFLDYYASSRLIPEQVAEIVGGMSAACKQAGCALLGGETAEMPGVYHEGHFDVCGTIVGVVEREAILPKVEIEVGDLLVGLPSSGPHTNGYSLIRKVFEGADLTHVYDDLGIPLGEALLAPHRSYYSLLWPVLQAHPDWIKALAHITGGGFIDNLPRVLPEGLSASISRSSWEVPALFQRIQRMGNIPSEEMYHVFNMGMGIVAVVGKESAHRLINALGEGVVIGQVIAGDEVQLV